MPEFRPQYPVIHEIFNNHITPCTSRDNDEDYDEQEMVGNDEGQ